MTQGIRGNLRPDLVGEVVRLDDSCTWELGTGETANLRIIGVFDADDREDVLVIGCWVDMDGPRAAARVMVRAAALPAYRPPEEPA
jgi:hypothetical protein